MLKRFKIILAMTLALLVWSCDDLRDNYDDCGIWLEFVFDHNMEFTDSFEQQVGSVDVLIFDEEGEFILLRSATVEELEGRKRMFLGGALPIGNYTVLTVGGLTEHFRFAHRDGSDFTRGITKLQDVSLALHQPEEGGTVSHEFPHLWYGKPVEINYRADLSVWQVPLIRQTNKFNIVLQHTLTKTRTGSGTRAEEDPIVFAAEIVAPEAGVYNHLNDPLMHEKLTYQPYSQQASIEPSVTGMVHKNTGRINTMRLLENEEEGYRLVIRNTDTGKEVQSYDLLELLAESAFRSDGTPIPLQEYLDREWDWDIVIIHNAPVTEGFTALKIVVNNWIVWDTDMEIQ